MQSDVEVRVTHVKDSEWKVEFLSWTAQVFDDYNWDHGKSVVVPGFGKINDEDAIRVERAGLARSFLIESDAWQVGDPAIVGPAVVFVN